MTPELVIKMNCTIGESPVWDERTADFYWIDNRQWKVYRWNGKTVDMIASFGQHLGFIALRELDGLAVGLKDGYHFVDTDSGKDTFIVSPEPGRNNGRFNDGKADPAGRLWGGTQTTHLDDGSGEVLDDSGLYCMDEHCHVKKMLSGVIQGNGMGWSSDSKKFYFIDSERYCVQEFDYDIDKNELSNGRGCVNIPSDMGIPDGMAVDDEGNIWVALWAGYAVVKFDPIKGTVMEKVELPVPNVTSCCFGGADFTELYVTTAALATDLEKYPLAGSVFKIKTKVPGRPTYRFKG